MKREITLLFALVLQGTVLLSQNQLLNPENYKYYIRTTNNEIRDARDFKIVFNQFPEGETRLSSDKKYLLVHNAGTIYCMNLNGKVLAKTAIPPNANLSPKWNKILYTENRDLWTSDVNWKTGKIDNKQKITELGIFGPNDAFNLYSWYNNVIALPMENWVSENLRIDLKSKAVEPMYVTQEPNYSRIGGSPSPDGKYLIHTGFWNGANISVNDLLNNKITKTDVICSDKAEKHIWLNNKQFFFEGDFKAGDWFIFDLGEMKVVKKFSGIDAFSRNVETPGALKSSCVSLNSTYIILHIYANDNTKANFLIINAKTGKITHASVGSNVSAYTWLSDEKLIFSQMGSVTIQGTWIMDVPTGEIKKISGYQSNGFVNLSTAKQVLFSANNYIWRVNHDGTELIQLTNTPQNYFGIKDFINFYDLEVDANLAGNDNVVSPQASSVNKTQTSQKNTPPKPNPVAKTAQTGVVKTQQGSNLRLRAEASDKASVIAQIPNGSLVKILGEDDHLVTVNKETGKWLKVDYNGVEGWAWGNFILRQ